MVIHTAKKTLPKQLTNPVGSSYINKAVEGNSPQRTTQVAPRANLFTLNLDNYIV